LYLFTIHLIALNSLEQSFQLLIIFYFFEDSFFVLSLHILTTPLGSVCEFGGEGKIGF